MHDSARAVVGSANLKFGGGQPLTQDHPLAGDRGDAANKFDPTGGIARSSSLQHSRFIEQLR